MNWDKLKNNMAITWDMIQTMFSIFMMGMLLWITYKHWEDFVLGIGMIFMLLVFSLSAYWGVGRLTK